MAIMTGALPDGRTALSRGGQTVGRGVGLGAFAERVITPVSGAIKVADDTPLEIACVIGCAVQTGVGAVLNTARVPEGATVLIMGAGGIGVSILQGAQLAGAAQIIVADPVEERRDTAKRFGASAVLDPAVEDVVAVVQQLTGGVGVDYAFDAVGAGPVIETCIAATRRGGTTTMVGAGGIDQTVTLAPPVLFSVAEKKLVGCLLGGSNGRSEIPRLLALWRSGRLDLEGLITHRRPLAEINEAFADMTAGRGLRTVLSM